MVGSDPTAPGGLPLAAGEQMLASCATSSHAHLWLTNRRLIFVHDRGRGEGAARVFMVGQIADVTHAYFERRWQTAIGWGLAGVSVAFCAYLLLWLLATIGTLFRHFWFNMLEVAAVVVILVWTARRYYLALRLSGRARPCVIHYARANAPAVRELVATLTSMIASP